MVLQMGATKSEPMTTDIREVSSNVVQEDASADLTANESLDLKKRLKTNKQQSVRKYVEGLHTE